MEYTVNDLSKAKKSIQVTVPVATVDAKIDFMIRDLGRDLKIPGFRPGKVPHKVVEKRYKDQVYKEATSALINENAAEIVKEIDVTPLSEINYDGPEVVERGKEFKFTFDFEIVPEFELPTWEGIAIDEEIKPYDEATTDETIERIRIQMSELMPLEVSRPAENGEIAFIDFLGTDENGKEVEGFRGTGYQLVMGQGQLQDDFENIVKKLAPGETGEGPVEMTAQTNDPSLTGKIITVKATVVSLAQRVLPELTDEFAEKIGAGTVQNMRDSIVKAHKENLQRTARENTQGSLLDGLLEKVDYELPPSIVENRQNTLLAEFKANMKRAGKPDPKDWDKPEAEFEAELQKQAEKFVKGEMFLLKLAKIEKIDVAPHEMEAYLADIAQRSGIEPRQLQEYYHQNHLMQGLVDRIKSEKALALIYERANVKEVVAKPKAASKTKAVKKTGTAEKKAPAKKTEK